MPAASYQMLGTAPPIDATFDLREETAYRLIRDAFVTLVQPRNRVLRIIGPARIDPRILVDVTIDEEPLRHEMYDYSGRILLLSIVLSLITASLVFFSLHLLMVRPMRRITARLVAFRDDPEDASKDLGATTRADEIGVAPARAHGNAARSARGPAPARPPCRPGRGGQQDQSRFAQHAVDRRPGLRTPGRQRRPQGSPPGAGSGGGHRPGRDPVCRDPALRPRPASWR